MKKLSLLKSSNKFFFSTSETKPTTSYTEDPEFKAFVAEEELSKNEALREKTHRFEREWRRLYEDQRQKDLSKPVKQLNEFQKKKVDYLVEKTQNLNMLERKYFTIMIRDQIIKTTGFNPLKINNQWPEFKELGL